MGCVRQFRCGFAGCNTSRANKRNNLERHIWTRHVRELLNFQPHVRYVANYHKAHVEMYVQSYILDSGSLLSNNGTKAHRLISNSSSDNDGSSDLQHSETNHYSDFTWSSTSSPELDEEGETSYMSPIQKKSLSDQQRQQPQSSYCDQDFSSVPNCSLVFRSHSTSRCAPYQTCGYSERQFVPVLAQSPVWRPW